MEKLLNVLTEIVPFIFLIFISLLIEFRVRYILLLDIKNFYIRGIRIVILIIVAIKLNEYGGIYSYLSFILTYLICAMLDRRYRSKIEDCWEVGTNAINNYIDIHQRITIRKWLGFRFQPFKEVYKEAYDIFTFKLVTISIFFIILYLLVIYLIP